MELLLSRMLERGENRDYDRGMPIELRTFGERVAWLLRRPEMDMSQKELAAGMGISEQFLSALIKGKSRPNVQHLRTMARLLHTSVDFLALETETAAAPSTTPPPNAPACWTCSKTARPSFKQPTRPRPTSGCARTCACG